MRYEVLGPLRVTVDGAELTLGGPQQRLVLAVLISADGQAIRAGNLIDRVWGENEPATAKKTLQGYVHHLRSQVGDALKTEGGGYSLDTGGEVDALEFVDLREEGASILDTDPVRASEHFRAALSLWRGPALADLDGQHGVAAEISRLESLRITTLGDRIDADLACGGHRSLIGEIEGLTQEFPLQERFRAQHMLALFRAGRHVEALRSYERMRRFLADEMGLEPSAELQRLENDILAGDESLKLEQRDNDDVAAVRGYELRELITADDMGETYRAYQRSVGREVAIRVLGPATADDPTFIATFLADTQRVASLEHPHVAVVYDTWREPGRAHQVSRWFASSLSDELQGGKRSLESAMRLLDQVGGALAFAHRHDVVHGSIDTDHVGLDAAGDAFLTGFVVGSGSDVSQSDDLREFVALAHAVIIGRPATSTPSGDEINADGADVPAAVLGVLTAGLASEGEFSRVDDFLRSLRQCTGTDTVAPIDAPTGARREVRNPYKGLRAFQESDADDFYGRDDLIDRLVDRLDSTRLVAVVGPSGSGKSSAVKAGLAARLRDGGNNTTRLQTEMFPGAFPFEELAGALLRVGVNRDSVIDDLVADDRGLLRVLKQILPAGDAELLLVIDQFEELFSMVGDRQVVELFLDSLTVAVNDPRSRLRVVVTMRADFFDRPLENPGFGALLETGLVSVTLPDAMGLAAAIAQPAISVGLEVEDGLTDRIVRDLDHQPGGLPLLQYAMTELVEHRQNDRLTFAGYESIGGVFGALGRRAEELYQALTPAAQEAIRQAFLRMVSVDETADDLRRRVSQAELAAADVDVHALNDGLQAFGAHRLLTFDRDPVTRARTVEVAHEALTREWPRLRAWIADHRDDLIVRRRLDSAIVEWEAADRDPSFLPSGSRLGQFQEWTVTTTLALTNGERFYLEAGREQAEIQEAKSVRRRRVAFTSLSVVTSVLAVLSLYAFAQRSNANEAADETRSQTSLANEAAVAAEEQRLIVEAQGFEAEALQLAVVSGSVISDDPELAIHLALEAAAYQDLIGVDLPEVTSALYNSSFADRLVSRLQFDVGNSAFFLMVDGINQINAAGTLGLQPTTGVDPDLGRFPTALEVVQLSDGAVLGRIEEPSGIGSHQWDPSTGEILTLSLAGELSWRDTETLETTRSLAVQENGLFLGRVGDLVSYSVVTDFGARELQTHVLDVETGAEVFVGPPDAFNSHVSPSGEMVAIFDDFNFIRVFDLASGEEVNVIEVPSIDHSAWRWGAIEDTIVYSIEPFDVRVVDPRTTDVLRERSAGFYLFSLSPSPDGRLIAAAGSENSVLLLDANTLDDVAELPIGPSQALELLWSADSTTLVTSQLDGSSIVWDLGEVTTAAQSVPRVSESFVDFGFAEGNRVLVAGLGGGGELRDRDSDDVAQTFSQRDQSLYTMARVSSDGSLLAVPESETSVAIVNVADGSTRAITSTDHHQAVAFSRDGKLLLTGNAERGGRGRGVVELPASDGYSVHATETGALVYSSAENEVVNEWVSVGAFAPNGDLAVSVGREPVNFDGPVDLRLVVHRAGDGAVLVETPIQEEFIDLEVSSDGSFLAALDTRGVLRLYDMNALRVGNGVGAEFASAEVGIFSIAITPDGQLVVSGASGALTARSVEQDLRVVWSIDGAPGSVGSVEMNEGYVWTSISERLGSGADVGLVGFPLDRGELLSFAESKLSRELTSDECQRYLGLVACSDRRFGSG